MSFTKVMGLAAIVCLAASLGCDALRGPEGDTGPQGPQGLQGEAGPPGKDGDIEGASGERLRRLFRVTEDGGRAFETWHDEEIGGNCTFFVAADGDERCLPYDACAVPIALMYTDPECSQPLAFIAQDVYGTLPPAFSYKLPGQFGMRARRLSFQAEPPDMLYHLAMVGKNVVCFEASPAVGLYYNVEPELSPDAFIAGTVEIE